LTPEGAEGYTFARSMKTLLACVVALVLVPAMRAQGPLLPRPAGPLTGVPSVLLLDSASAPVTGAPFSAVELVQWQETYTPGNLMMQQRQSAIYRDGSGRLRMERLNASSGSGTLITIVDPVAGYFYELNPKTLLGIRTPIDHVTLPPPSREGAEPHAPGDDRNMPQVETMDLGSQQMSGVTATGTRTTLTFHDDGQDVQSVREQWVSPDLHLALLTTQSVSSGVQSTVQLTNLVRAEPDPALFQVPAGYLIQIWPAVHLPNHS
jgi:hypothetical protein